MIDLQCNPASDIYPRYIAPKYLWRSLPPSRKGGALRDIQKTAAKEGAVRDIQKRLRGRLPFTEINMFLANPDIINNSFNNGLNKSGLQLSERGDNIMMFSNFVYCLGVITGRLDFLAYLNL